MDGTCSMPADHYAGKSPLTICAIGASESTHVVSRVRAFAARGHRVYLLCSRVSGIAGVTEIVPQAEPTPFLRRFLGWIDAWSIRLLKKSIAPHQGTISLLFNHLHMLKRYK